MNPLITQHSFVLPSCSSLAFTEVAPFPLFKTSTVFCFSRSRANACFHLQLSLVCSRQPKPSFRPALQWPGQGCGSCPCQHSPGTESPRKALLWQWQGLARCSVSDTALPRWQPGAAACPGFLTPNFQHSSNGKAPELIKSQLWESSINDCKHFCKKKTKPKHMNAFQGQHDKPPAKKKTGEDHTILA